MNLCDTYVTVSTVGLVLVRQTYEGTDSESREPRPQWLLHTIFRRAFRPDRGATAVMAMVAVGGTPALLRSTGKARRRRKHEQTEK